MVGCKLCSSAATTDVPTSAHGRRKALASNASPWGPTIGTGIVQPPLYTKAKFITSK